MGLRSLTGKSFRLNHAVLRHFFGSRAAQRPEKEREGVLPGARARPIRPPRGRPRRPLCGLPPEGHDVLHEADELTLLELTLEAVSRAVLLRLLADDQEGEA